MYGMPASGIRSHVREAIRTGRVPRIENRRPAIRSMSGFDECACAPDAVKTAAGAGHTSRHRFTGLNLKYWIFVL